MGYSPWGHKQLDMTERLTFTFWIPVEFKVNARKCRQLNKTLSIESEMQSYREIKLHFYEIYIYYFI